MIELELLEGLALKFRRATGVSSPVDAFVVAELCGFATKPWGSRDAQLREADDLILYPSPVKVRLERIQFKILHEVSHWWLRRNGHAEHEEEDADALASLLLLPREDFLRDRNETEWDLFRLKERHPNASFQAIVVRMCQLSPAASASVWDARKLHAAYGQNDPSNDFAIMDRVFDLETPVREGDVSAWPVFDNRWRRVVVIRKAA